LLFVSHLVIGAVIVFPITAQNPYPAQLRFNVLGNELIYDLFVSALWSSSDLHLKAQVKVFQLIMSAVLVVAFELDMGELLNAP